MNQLPSADCGMRIDAEQTTSPGTVELHIGELVLHGVAPTDGYAVGDAVQRELTRLLAESGIPPELARGSGIERVDGGQLELSAGASAQTIGAGIAQAVYGSLGR